ncbi:MAG: DinB family protein [bacterium]
MSTQTTTMLSPLMMEMEKEAEATRRLLERVPEDRLDWRPHAKSFSLGELALHIAAIPAHIANMSRQSPYEMSSAKKQGPPKHRAEILDTFEKSQREAMKIWGETSDQEAMSEWSATLQGKPVFAAPRIGLARVIGMNHLYHHRGQLTVYLRLLDVPLPSVYGPTADENPFA